MWIEIIDKIDNLMQIIYKKYRDRWEMTDEEFSKSEEIKNIAFEIIDIFKEENIKTTYEHLTNMNFHTLVKILNFHNYFKDLTKEEKERLKKFSLLI